MSYLSHEYPTLPRSYNLTTSNHFLLIFLVLQISGGLILLPPLLFTFLFSRATPRDATLNNLLFCFILIAFGSAFSFWTGDATRLVENRGWCIAQSIIIYTALPMTGTASCALALNLSANIYMALYRPKWGSKWRSWRCSIVLGPYVVGAAFAIAAALIAGMFPASISTGVPVFTCTFVGYDFVNATLIYTGSALAVQLVIQVFIFIALFRNWRVIRARNQKLNQQNASSAYIRISLFSTWAALSGAAALISVWLPSSPIPGLISATDPLAAFLIFGTQRDVISVWQFWKTKKPRAFQLIGGSEKSETASNIRRHSV